MGHWLFVQAAFCTCHLYLQITQTATEMRNKHRTGCRGREVFFILQKSRQATREVE